MLIHKQLVIPLIIVTTILLGIGSAHFALTYPPARFPDYDFLDNVRTGGPCGVPNGKYSRLAHKLCHVCIVNGCCMRRCNHVKHSSACILALELPTYFTEYFTHRSANSYLVGIIMTVAKSENPGHTIK